MLKPKIIRQESSSARELGRGRFGHSMALLSLSSFKFPSGAKFWKKRSENGNEFRSIYLGNVLTSWARGESCADKPLATLWANYASTEKTHIMMKVTMCPTGLKALTREHGLTEYWTNRITFCIAHPDYPKVFCWIYRHDGRKMKQELRCHAILCPNEALATTMCKKLRDKIHQAMLDFKREKILHLDLLPDNFNRSSRKVFRQTGSKHRVRLERRKSSSKLNVIEEAIGEEDEEVEPNDSMILNTQNYTIYIPKHSDSCSALAISHVSQTETEVCASQVDSGKIITSSRKVDTPRSTIFLSNARLGNDWASEIEELDPSSYDDQVSDALVNLKIDSKLRLTQDVGLVNPVLLEKMNSGSPSGEEMSRNEFVDFDSDLTVKGIMVNEYSSFEKFKYLHRLEEDLQKEFLQNKVTDVNHQV